MKETGAHIEISHGKDQSLSFLVTGKKNEVLKARFKILSHFQTQVSVPAILELPITMSGFRIEI